MSFSEHEIEEFKVEALELLELAEKSLLGLDQGGDFRSSFDAVFRGFHSLKGAAGMMDLHALQTLTHELESMLVNFKDQGSIPKDYINLFLRGIDASRHLLDGQEVNFDFSVGKLDASQDAAAMQPASLSCQSAEDSEDPKSLSSLLPPSAVDEFVSECDEIVERISNSLQSLETKNFTRETVDSLYRDIHSLKGSAYLFSYNKLGDLAHTMESSMEGIRNGTHVPSEKLIDQLFKSLKMVEVIIERIKAKSSDEDLEIIISIIKKALDAATNELEIVSTEDTANAKEVPEVPFGGITASVDEAGDPPSQNHFFSDIRTSSSSKESEGASSIRVPVSLLDNLMTLMGEMVLVRNQVLQFSNKSEDLEFLSMSKRLNAVTTEIQGEMMKTRMQPIGNVLNKFTRIVRDLSHDLNKNITLNIFGADTELDKTLLEAIKDPLTHIVRNSCDHGIELPDERQKSGKTRNGHINIRSYHEGGQVIIEVADDGRGLSKDAIVKKAVEKGLLSEDRVNKISEKEIFNLIFAPGFSTAAKVTNVSGRGVGMDVVRTNIEQIGGIIDLSSVAGIGTTIKIKIPLTLAIIPALIVKCSGNTFAIPQVKLEELVLVDQSNANNKIEILHGAPVLRLRGNILPLVNLNSVLKIEEQNSINYENGIINIAVLNGEHSSFGLIIDEIQDTADIVVKPLNNLLKSLHVYSGATILGNGAVALILDVLGIAKASQIGLDKPANNKINDELPSQTSSLSDVQDYLLIGLNSSTRHALVLGYVHRLEEFRRQDIEYSGAYPVIRYRNNILPLLNANEQLGYGRRENSSEVIPVVVVQKAGSLFGIEVDAILDTLSTSIEMETCFVEQAGIFGSLNTKDELIVVVDPFEIIVNAFPNLKTSVSMEPSEDQSKDSHGIVSNNFYPGQPKGHVLVVEDTVFFRKAIKIALENAGYQVTVTNNGQEALSVLNHANTKVDLIVSDIEMPKINGFQLAKNVRKHPVYSSVPMIAVSSLADNKNVQEGLRVGFNAYLEKLNQRMLLSTVSELLGMKHERGIA